MCFFIGNECDTSIHQKSRNLQDRFSVSEWIHVDGVRHNTCTRTSESLWTLCKKTHASNCLERYKNLLSDSLIKGYLYFAWRRNVRIEWEDAIDRNTYKQMRSRSFPRGVTDSWLSYSNPNRPLLKTKFPISVTRKGKQNSMWHLCLPKIIKVLV